MLLLLLLLLLLPLPLPLPLHTAVHNHGIIAATTTVAAGAFFCCYPKYVFARVTRWLILVLLLMTLLPHTVTV